MVYGGHSISQALLSTSKLAPKGIKRRQLVYFGTLDPPPSTKSRLEKNHFGATPEARNPCLHAVLVMCCLPCARGTRGEHQGRSDEPKQQQEPGNQGFLGVSPPNTRGQSKTSGSSKECLTINGTGPWFLHGLFLQVWNLLVGGLDWC